MNATVAPAIRRIAWLAAAIAALWRCGVVLPAPSVHSVAALEGWFRQAGEAVALLAVARIGALLVAGLLLALAIVRLVVLVFEAAQAAVDERAPSALRQLARGMAGLGLTAGLTPVLSMNVPLDGEPEVAVPLADDLTSGTATMRRIDEPGPQASQAGPAPALPAAPSSDPAFVADSVVVAHGDSLWSIAAEVVSDRGGPSDDASVARYWRRLIAENRTNLVDPTNPDLIHPGQRLTLPAG
jgi:NADH:ubiquinone oxidoreductase subunit 6 (subunit J)